MKPEDVQRNDAIRDHLLRINGKESSVPSCQPRIPAKGCEECGQLSPFHAPTCKRLPAREDLIATLRDMLAAKAQELESVYSSLRRVVANFNAMRPLLPDPELPQDLAFLCHVINGQQESLNAALKSSVEEAGELERTKLQNNELRSALADAILEVKDWASYAGEYFQEKWDLQGTLERLQARLDAASTEKRSPASENHERGCPCRPCRGLVD